MVEVTSGVVVGSVPWSRRYTAGMANETGTKDDSAAIAERAWVELAPMLRKVAERKFRIEPADADGVVSAAFESFLLRQRTVTNVERYLFISVCNASRDYWRRRRFTEPLPEGIEESAAICVDNEERIVRQLTVALTLAKLGQKCSDALYLHHVGGYSAVQIAELLKTTEQYVWQLLSRCRNRARVMLAAVGRRS